MHRNHGIFITAIHARTRVELHFYSKDDGGELFVRSCAPMDYGPSRRAKVPVNRYHFWDLRQRHDYAHAEHRSRPDPSHQRDHPEFRTGGIRHMAADLVRSPRLGTVQLIAKRNTVSPSTSPPHAHTRETFGSAR
jgi:hypothetical protein